MSIFGRKENYDEYNEKYNAKYDDDYIREEKEYRAECGHDHGQTYKNEEYRAECDHTHGQTYDEKEYRAECGHDHGQTYENFNSEQKSYDELSELENKFAPHLAAHEHIMWCGKAEKDAKFNEQGIGGIGCLGYGFIIFAVLIVLSTPIIGICIIIYIVYLMKDVNVKKREYAITNKRFIVLNGEKIYSVPIGSIEKVTYRSSPRNIGSVWFTCRDQMNSNKQKVIFYNGIFAIKDPAKVRRIMEAAIAGNINF